MKYSAILLAVAASVTAQFSDPTAQVIADGLAGISAATSSLNTDVQAYSGAADSEKILSGSEAVIASIQSATSNLQNQPQMPGTALGDALGLIDPTTALGNTVSETIDNVIAKKQAFVDACQGPTVLDQLNQQKAAAVELIELVVVKTPTGTESIVRDTAQPLLDALDRGVAAFADQTSLPATCGASSAPTAAPTSAAPSSAASSDASAAPSSAASGVVTLPTGSATPAPTSGKPTGSPVLPSGLPETCLPTTTTVTVTVPWTPVPTHPGAPSGQPPVVTGHSTYVPGKPTPTPVTPPQFTGAAVANGVTFGGFAAAGLAMLAVF